MSNFSPRSAPEDPANSNISVEKAPKKVLRDSNGRLLRGSLSPNPTGKHLTSPQLVKAAREYTREALEVCAEIMLKGRRDADRLKAIEIILERGHGKAQQNAHLEVTVDGKPQELTLEALQTAAAEILERVRSQTVIVEALPAEEGAFRALPAPPVDSAEPGATTLAPEPGKSS